jgi:hypothetical protein
VTSGSSDSLWHRFEHDPRDPAYAGVRAGDRDRAVVHDVLAEAYAEGRLDRDELDERTAAVDTAKTYADLLPPIRDLTADSSSTPASSSRADLERSAAAYYRDKLRETFFEFLIPNLICWAIWFMTGHDYFVWPIFVTIPTFANLARVATSRDSIVQGRIEKLQRREAKALEPKEPSPGTPTDSSGPILREDQEKPEET